MVKDAEGNRAPDARGLARALAEKFEISIGDDDLDLPTVSELVELRKGRPELEAFLTDKLQNLIPDESLVWLLSLPWKAIYTTNYDGVIERAFDSMPNPPRTPVVMSASSEVTAPDLRFELPVVHLHGYLFTAGTKRILITSNDYAQFKEKRRMLFEMLKYNSATSPFLYIGYSQKDPNWKMVLAELKAEFAPSKPPSSFRLVRKDNPIEAELLRASGIELVTGEIEDFATSLRQQLGALKVDPGFLDKVKADIPSDLHDAFQESPSAVARLLRGWEYVNQAAFHGTPNTASFLRGDAPNWAVIGNGSTFERDVEESVFEELLDFATSPNPGTRSILTLGAAGYGVSTILKRLAVRLIRDKAGRVFQLRSGQQLIDGDVIFAAQAAQQTPVFFVVDNAAEEAERVRSIMQRLRELGLSACFLLGERTNEWRQNRIKVPVREFGVLPLSDAEISRLLDCLKAHSSLGQLANLDRSLQVAAIKERHEKQLLVALRETTEGKAFDAIIEDEYRNIQSEFARHVYATVCCFYRHRALIRDLVLAEVMGKPMSDLYRDIGAQLEGIVSFDLIDPATGTYAARARHHTIADIVALRSVPSAEREDILLKALQALNLNFHGDVRAFDALIRSDETIDSFTSLDTKTKFFELAAKKDPTSPYVRQHYARMLLREEKPELALAEIDNALKLDSSVRVLSHTRGVILRFMALRTESLEVARRRLLQSEEEFRRNISRDSRDAYSYQSLAELYLSWAADRAPTEEEAVDYVGRAESVIKDGLSKVWNREGLYIASAKIKKFLGEKPQMLEALNRAIQAGPENIIARQILGRELRRQGRADEAVKVLHEILKRHPEEVIPAIEYALALDALQRPYAESIAVLRLASLYGVRDPRYLATLGGFNALNGNLSDAKEIFRKSETQTFAERSKIHFKPNARPSGDKMSLEGTVVLVKPGFAFIQVPGMLDVYCPSKIESLVMSPGMKVKFTIGFTARGPVAMDLRSA